jgi:hypothetical protein
MRATKVLLGSACAVLAACNPGDFDSLLDQAPVVSFSPEGPSTGSLLVLPLPPPGEPGTTAAARMLVSRKDGGFLGIADFDMKGKVKVHKLDTGSLGDYFVYSAAVRGDGAILAGTPSYGGGETPGGKVFRLFPTPDISGGYSLNAEGGLPGTERLGMAVAAGNVTGVAPGNFVVLGDNAVEVLGDDINKRVAATNSGLCPALRQADTAGGFYAYRPLAVGDLLTGGFDEIVLSNNQGAVLFLQYDGTETLPCPPIKTLTMPPYAGFGTSLAVGDFNGDGHQDLAVGAPLNNVYVYFGPLDTVTAPSVTIQSTISPTRFGERIASYQAPGALAAQLLVGDRAGAPSGGPAGTGRVLLFNIGNVPVLNDFDAAAILFDSSSESGEQEFGGTNLGGLFFNTGLCVPGGGLALVPWASTNLDVLTFFDYVSVPAPNDPRCFAAAQ